MAVPTVGSVLVTNLVLVIRLKGVQLSHCYTHFTFSFMLALSLLLTNYKAQALSIDTNFSLPSPLPHWLAGSGFATGAIDLGGLEVRQVTTFTKVWTAKYASFLEPSPIPEGFSMLGTYAQSNDLPLFGWVLVGKTNARDESGDILKQPIDYALIWYNSFDVSFYWIPVPPDGYKPVGLIVTGSPDKPPLGKIRCVRSDFTTDAEIGSAIWNEGAILYTLMPRNRWMNSAGVSVGAFMVINDDDADINTPLPLSCLLNKNSNSGRLKWGQVDALIGIYAPYIFLHPKENYLPSSVEWFFSNGALLYKKGEEGNPVRVEPYGANLPQGGWEEEGLYWLDLPADDGARDMVKKGDLESASAYFHFKPILGGTFTDIQVWIFYPFNGHATLKLGFIKRISLGKIGEHVGDWEHVTLRVSNLDGVLRKVYLSQHGGGEWVDASVLEYEGGSNRFAVYASRNGHAGSFRQGLMLQGPPGLDVGIRNDWERGDKVFDTARRFAVVGEEVEGPPWINYSYKWGPTKNYETAAEVRKVKRWLLGKLKKLLEAMVKVLDEIFGKDGPRGPKTKNNWSGDE